MKSRNVFLTILFIVLVVAGGLWLWQPRAEAAGDSQLIQSTGSIEVEEISIASQTGGTIVELMVEQGDFVEAGQVVAQLDSDMLEADLARTRASIETLTAAREAAYTAWQTALDARDNPIEIDLQIAEAQTRLDLAELQVEAAQLSGDPAALALAEATRDGLQTTLKLLQAMRAEPYAIIAQASQAEMFYRGMESFLELALSGQEMLELQIAKMRLTAPRSGYVIERPLSEGEIAAPLAPILVIADLTHVTLTTYISENEYGRVSLGDTARVSVDSLPDQVFEGKVVYISPNAEFTPTNVQTKEDRTRLVYAVKIALDNPELLLKPGMIADVIINPPKE